MFFLFLTKATAKRITRMDTGRRGKRKRKKKGRRHRLSPHPQSPTDWLISWWTNLVKEEEESLCFPTFPEYQQNLPRDWTPPTDFPSIWETFLLLEVPAFLLETEFS
jgi:hypothetical protein